MNPLAIFAAGVVVGLAVALLAGVLFAVWASSAAARELSSGDDHELPYAPGESVAS